MSLNPGVFILNWMLAFLLFSTLEKILNRRYTDSKGWIIRYMNFLVLFELIISIGWDDATLWDLLYWLIIWGISDSGFQTGWTSFPFLSTTFSKSTTKPYCSTELLITWSRLTAIGLALWMTRVRCFVTPVAIFPKWMSRRLEHRVTSSSPQSMRFWDFVLLFWSNVCFKF